MNSRSSSHSLGRPRTARRAETRAGVWRYMSQAQTEAYLLARDTVRRVQRMATFMDGSGLPGKGHNHRPDF